MVVVSWGREFSASQSHNLRVSDAVLRQDGYQCPHPALARRLEPAPKEISAPHQFQTSRGKPTPEGR